jgi:hypothetical protein
MKILKVVKATFRVALRKKLMFRVKTIENIERRDENGK